MQSRFCRPLFLVLVYPARRSRMGCRMATWCMHAGRSLYPNTNLDRREAAVHPSLHFICSCAVPCISLAALATMCNCAQCTLHNLHWTMCMVRWEDSPPAERYSTNSTKWLIAQLNRAGISDLTIPCYRHHHHFEMAGIKNNWQLCIWQLTKWPRQHQGLFITAKTF